jgi:hypothetical protein
MTLVPDFTFRRFENSRNVEVPLRFFGPQNDSNDWNVWNYWNLWDGLQFYVQPLKLEHSNRRKALNGPGLDPED